jgi:hypothetical protein
MLTMAVWLITLTFVSSNKSNKKGPTFVEGMLIIETPVLKYICFVGKKIYSVKADVLQHRPMWRLVCLSVYQIQFLLNEYLSTNEI